MGVRGSTARSLPPHGLRRCRLGHLRTRRGFRNGKPAVRQERKASGLQPKPAGLLKERIGPHGRHLMGMGRGLIAVGLTFALLASTAAQSRLIPLKYAFGASRAHVYPLPARVAAAPVDEDLETMFLNLINQERVAAGLVPLMPHGTIQFAARAHGREMFARGYLTHISRDGRTPRDRILGLGVHVRLIGENLAYASDAKAAHEALMASEPHRQNIFLPAFRLIGVAVVDGGADGVIVVEDFSDEGATYHLPKWWEAPAATIKGRSNRGR